MPNLFAFIVLFSWPVVVIVLFRALPRVEALLWSIVAGYLLLPNQTAINLPHLHILDKNLVPALTAALILVLTRETTPPTRRDPKASDETPAEAGAVATGAVRRSPFARQNPAQGTRGNASVKPVRTGRFKWMLRILILLLVLTPFATVINNGDPVPAGRLILPGLSFYDGLAGMLDALATVLPFLLGLRYLRRPEDHAALLRALCVSAAFYTIPILLELRLSPQISRWVYGFMAQSFAQAMRDGGYRPVVFLQHGLWLANFMAMASLAAFVLWRSQSVRRRTAHFLVLGLWLGLVLLLSHSLGSTLILVLIAPVVLLFGVRAQIIFATLTALSILIYPILRGAELAPIDTIYSISSAISQERADSFRFRVNNEEILLNHFEKKPAAGWGGWGRSRVYDDWGDDISVTDGYWIIVIGSSGWLGYIAVFGLFALPVAMLGLNVRRLGLSAATSGLCLVLAANLVDLIPDATVTPLTWLIAGALAGRVLLGRPDSVNVENETAERPAPQVRSRRGPAVAPPPRRQRQNPKTI